MTLPDSEAALVTNCLRWVNAFGGYVEVIGQRKAKGSGTSVGAPDAIVYRGGNVYVCEFKRAKGGVLSRGQELAIECRRREGVRTFVITSEQEFVDMLTRVR